ncbi:MAG TPA: tripartite tricarboxylate transporter TctB family protein [Alphaproteobacteria bacterium]|nr:tripartite tricarboxylate transporter TctB family protein [Alphaproteobacteria bacterium]
MASGLGAPLRRPHADLIVGIAVVVFAAIIYAATFTFDQAAFEMSGGMGPETFPRLVLGVIAALGAALAWRSRRRPPEPSEPVPAIVVYTGCLLFGFMLVTALVGMLAAMFLLVVALGLLWGERRIGVLCLSGAGMCAAIWAVFVRGLGVPLPSGILGPLLY